MPTADTLQVTNHLSDILIFAEKNTAIISFLLRSDVDISEVVVSCQKKWVNYRKIQKNPPRGL